MTMIAITHAKIGRFIKNFAMNSLRPTSLLPQYSLNLLERCLPCPPMRPL